MANSTLRRDIIKRLLLELSSSIIEALLELSSGKIDTLLAGA